jgi:hypothetical protein
MSAVAQLFAPQFGFLVTLSALGTGLLAATGILTWRALSGDPAGVNEALEQPVPFSHKHHVADDGLDCRYCHGSVERSSFAGIPPLSTCMTCHSQLYKDQVVLAPLLTSIRSGTAFQWARLNKLPDFVYFNHSIHVDKGVGCVSCHGPIDEMPLTARATPLTMQWCLSCHRRPESQLRPRSEVFNMHWSAANQEELGSKLLSDYRIDKGRLTDCSVCHR